MLWAVHNLSKSNWKWRWEKWLQVVENEQYFIILPIGYKAKSSKILSYFSYQTVSGQLPKPTSKERESTKGIDTWGLPENSWPRNTGAKKIVGFDTWPFSFRMLYRHGLCRYSFHHGRKPLSWWGGQCKKSCCCLRGFYSPSSWNGWNGCL